ncbi:hypothetical protein ACNQR7_30430 [Mycolicibacterium senegalense]|uniref:hypothetical protein n=1 Tax=Mycolicibacterium senegalense TaxID=1796 RepID=UPI003AAB1764
MNPTPGFGGAAGPDSGAADQAPASVPPKNRKPLIITATATVAVLAVIAVVVAFLMSKGGDGGSSFNPSGSPTEVAKAYLEALARGDARGALDLSATEPASTDLLTNDILKLQLEKLPITEIEVLGEERKPEDDKRTSAVKVAAKLGGQRTEGKLDMVVVDNQWKLSAAFVDATIEKPALTLSKDTIDSLRVFDKPLLPTGHFYVFPGYLQMTASTPYLTINDMPPTTFDDASAMGQPAKAEPKYSMTDAGRKAAIDAIQAWAVKCFNPGDNKGDCEHAHNPSWGNDYDIATMRVTGPIDLTDASVRLGDDASGPTVYTSHVRIPVTIAKKGGELADVDSITVSDRLQVNLGVQPPRAYLDH